MPDPEAAPEAPTAPETAGAPEVLLALETAVAPGAVALWRAGEVRSRELPKGVPTAESLLPALEALLDEAGLPLERVPAFAVSIGPGSFTGLRIGVATLKGLLFGTPLPVAPVPTLAALALTAGGAGDAGVRVVSDLVREDAPTVAMLDARRGEVYAAGYAAPGDLEPTVLPEGLYDADALAARLPARCRLVGGGAAICGDAVVRARGDGVRVEPEPAAPSAAAVARLGARMLSEGLARDVRTLVPRYVRRAEAEARRTGLPTEPRDPGTEGPSSAL